MKKVILVFLQLETDYFSSLFISEKCYSKQSHSSIPKLLETSFYTKKVSRHLNSTFILQEFQYRKKRNSTLIHPFIQQIHIHVCLQSFQRHSRHSSILLSECIFYSIHGSTHDSLRSSSFQKTPNVYQFNYKQL